MRRLTIIALLLGSLAVGWAVIPETAPTEPPPPDDPAHGLVYSGLRRQVGPGACRGNFELAGVRDRDLRPLCTHGPDPAPAGVDIRESVQPVSATASATPAPPSGVAAQGSVPCDGDGASGYRVQLIYARASNVTDRYAEYAASFQQWAGAIDSAFSKSAAETDGDRHVRFVHDASCNAVIDRVTLSTSGDDNLTNTINELRSKGYSRTDRKYLVWGDAKVYCGIAQVYYDDSPGSANASNGNTAVPGEVARVDSGCWGQASSAEAHELVHTLGGVQTSAPNATSKNHCRDEYDRLCYPDGSGGAMKYVCPSSHEALLDCNHDDYFSTAPAGGSYLATHWNIANSRFLMGSGSAPSPATTTTTPFAAGVPSAPQGLYATQPTQTGAKGVVLFWSPPAAPNGTITGYNVYRGSGPTGLSLITTAGPSTTYTDATAASGKLYYYRVSALNSTGEGPASTVARMIGR